MTFNELITKYRKAAISEKDKGDKFERLMQSYLQTESMYANKFKHVWLWNEFIGKKEMGGHDIGIDIVALTHEGDYWAIQCKCYQEGAYLDKPAVDSFLSTSSKQFLDENLQTVRFKHRLWISTTNNWSTNATEAIKNQIIPVSRIGLYDLQQSAVDWEKLDQGLFGEGARTKAKTIRPHQKTAIDLAHDYFKDRDRGKLIMACGTGKTYASLKIAEKETGGNGLILFLVPSIALLGQTLREWSNDSIEPIFPICVCSDSQVTRTRIKNDDIDSFSVVDLALPASTDVKNVTKQLEFAIQKETDGLKVVFSTYQSLEVISEAQSKLSSKEKGVFDLIICDESHRTTGVALTADDSSTFIKVHDNDFISARKRLYMTATPRLYSDESKSKAAQADAILCSMDDESIYGEEIYRIGFGEAVERDLLTDYKVLILTLSEKDITPAIKKVYENKESEINADDASKLIGCINALSKQVLGDEGVIKITDPDPMRRAVAFCQNIKVSKKITDIFNSTTQVYIDSLGQEEREKMVPISSRHIDGMMSAPVRDQLLGWLKEGSRDNNECRVLTNVRCLSEGVDVPSLDAVLFLSARNSQVDVVQSVGRVMRKAEGKKYGYIIIPIIVPSDVEPDKALDDNERYKVVWTVLNALRAHDDRFNATINKIELNKKRPGQIIVGTPGGTGDGEGGERKPGEFGEQMRLYFQELQSAVYARMVQKVGDRRYWEQWAKNVGEIAERQVLRIYNLINTDGEHKKAFKEFIKGLEKNINPSITQTDAIEMLSQHIITKPVFEALFEGYSFVKNNPISVSMQKMIDLLEAQAIEKDTETLNKFYESVRMRAKGIDNAEGKQRVIVELYDKFFKTAFPKMVEKLGIVYTPVEVVDFIIHSVNDILLKEFGRSITEENIHILDPFTGTGTFITRLLQSGLIKEKDLERKYKFELHANEIVLLAYYIASINIENAYHDVTPNPNDGIGKEEYTPFDGIVLTDTFQLSESADGEKLFSEMFPENSERVKEQKKAPIQIIVGNPPYSIGQKSANDNAQNQTYLKLERRIFESYSRLSTGSNRNSLYDSYIKAFRWSTDRLDKTGGIICFVSNGAWLDGNSTDGFRKAIEKEFTAIYIFNLRGNARTQGELRRKEAGNVFGSGSRTPIAITLLVKNPEVVSEKATIHYCDIGDYLSREQKLKILKERKSFCSNDLELNVLEPNEYGDWTNFRNGIFENLIPIGSKIKNDNATFFLNIYSRGLGTSRDNWSYNFSKNELRKNICGLIENYNDQIKSFNNLKIKVKIEEFIDKDPKKIKWTSDLIKAAEQNLPLSYKNEAIVYSSYRPFNTQYLYAGKELVYEYTAVANKMMPLKDCDNLIITISCSGTTTGLSVLMTNKYPDLHYIGDTQCFPLYYYEENSSVQKSLFEPISEHEYLRRDCITNYIFERAQKQYGKNLTKEDIFYYVYGILHSNKYREIFANDLKKMLPRIPLVDEVKDFWDFSRAGRKLAALHLHYETVDPFPEAIIKGDDSRFYTVEKMRFPKKGQLDTIIYNSKITISNIPAKAYEYVVNGKSAIEWIMERYQVTVHKESGIKNDPNDWAHEVGNPRYILDLLLSIINVSVQTVEIVESLPKLNFNTVAKQEETEYTMS